MTALKISLGINIRNTSLPSSIDNKRELEFGIQIISRRQTWYAATAL